MSTRGSEYCSHAPLHLSLARAPPPAGFAVFSNVGLAGRRYLPKHFVALSSGSLIVSSVPVVEQASCSIYILDPARDLGMPACNYADPAIWPHALNVTGILGETEPLQHWQYQQAVQFQVEQAIIDNGARTERLSSADLVSWGRGPRAGLMPRRTGASRACIGAPRPQIHRVASPGIILSPKHTELHPASRALLLPPVANLLPSPLRSMSTCIAMRPGGQGSGGGSSGTTCWRASIQRFTCSGR